MVEKQSKSKTDGRLLRSNRNPSVMIAGTQALPVDTNSSGSLTASPTSAGTVGNEDRQPVSMQDKKASIGNSDGCKPLPQTKPTNNAGSSNGRTAAFNAVNAGSTPDPASTPKRERGRPKTITDMKAYKAAKARQYRAAKRT